MWIKPLTLAAAIAAAPAFAGYRQAPFHDRPMEVAALALGLLEDDGAAVPSDDPVLAAAAAAMLLISEIGLAEAYEEALEGEEEEGEEAEKEESGEDAFAAAYDMLQTVHRLLAVLPAGDATADVADLAARLDALIPTRETPETLDADPEAAEVLAQALVGALERAVDADLYLGRDLARAMDTIAGLAAAGCAGESITHVETAALFFEDVLEAPLSVMTPDPAEEIEEAFEALLDDGFAAAPCDDLGDTFAEAKGVLFPGATQ